ncbi:uncharacterized protein LOC144482253 isoform X1 [Mustelus asterias]
MEELPLEVQMIENSSLLYTCLLRPSPSSIFSFPRMSGAVSGWDLFRHWKSAIKAEKKAQQIGQHLFRERNSVSFSGISKLGELWILVTSPCWGDQNCTRYS